MSDDFGFWDVMISIFWFTILLAWISLLVHILIDIFRDENLGGSGMEEEVITPRIFWSEGGVRLILENSTVC